ncbi:hypothetical protein BGZ76_003547 [Entomortierella beljakovae]|nr:hypothetical protein BGZ76_003547 [Entomortierella beljakovae]
MNPNNTIITNRTDTQWGAKTTIGEESWEPIESIMNNRLTYACVHKNFTTCVGISEPYSAPPTFNQTDLPQTAVTKFIDVNELVSVITLTTVRFQYSPPTGTLATDDGDDDDPVHTDRTIKFLEATRSIFSGSNELFSNMNKTIDPSDRASIWTEVIRTDLATEVLICYITKNIAVNCRYHIVRAFHLKSDDIPQIPKSLRLHLYQKLITMMTIQHLPMFKNGTISPIDVTLLRKRTYDSAEYMAKLGQNYALDHLGNTLYIVYDSTNSMVGYSPRIGFEAPNLMRTKIRPLRFEGAKVVPDIEDIELLEENKSISRRSIIRAYH